MVATSALLSYPPDSARGDISATTVWIVCALLYAVFMAAAAFWPEITTGFGRGYEFGLFETFQNITLAAAVFLALAVLRHAESNLMRVWLVLIALGSFLLLGEEASWGQHYFGWETTGWFAQHNDQGETNLHNTPDGWFDQKPRMVLQLGMILGGIVHPLLQKFRNGRGLFDNPWWFAPTFACTAPVIFSFIAGAPKAIDKLSILPVQLQFYRASEMEECFLYVFFVVYLLSLAARLRFRRTQHG
jgi:hypothetical protein